MRVLTAEAIDNIDRAKTPNAADYGIAVFLGVINVRNARTPADKQRRKMELRENVALLRAALLGGW